MSYVICLHIGTPTTCKYTLSLPDALPISLDIQREIEAPRAVRRDLIETIDVVGPVDPAVAARGVGAGSTGPTTSMVSIRRSEEHTSELQSQSNLVCRLLLEKKN